MASALFSFFRLLLRILSLTSMDDGLQAGRRNKFFHLQMDFGHSALSQVIKTLRKKMLPGLELSVTYLTMYLEKNLCGTIISGQKIIPLTSQSPVSCSGYTWKVRMLKAMQRTEYDSFHREAKIIPRTFL